MTTLHFVLSATAPMLTIVGAVLWAGYATKGLSTTRRADPVRDLRTW